jgi:hypothetical protein
MAITIRNNIVEARVRKIGAETGEGPSALIARLIEDEDRRLSEVQKFELARRRHAMRELLATLPQLSDAQKAAMDQVQEQMFDDNGLPK